MYWTLIVAFWFACYFSLFIVTSNNGEYMKVKHSVNVVNSWASPLILSNIYLISMCKLVCKMLKIAYQVLLQSSGLRTVYHVDERISLRKVVHENTFNMIWFTNSWAVHNHYTTLNYRERINKLWNSKKPKKCSIPDREINLKQILIWKRFKKSSSSIVGGQREKSKEKWQNVLQRPNVVSLLGKML